MVRLVRIAVFVALAGEAFAQRAAFRRIRLVDFPEAQMRGGVLVPRGAEERPQVLAWGDRLRLLNIPAGKATDLAGPLSAGRGGCLADINGDGQQDIVLHYLAREKNDLGSIVWLAAPNWEPSLIDVGAEFSDCLATTLHGKAGILFNHRFSQLRFYEIPASGEKWKYREVYSIYTPSAQGGIARGDADQDGLSDVFLGNYWLKAPATVDGGWRLFAINDWWNGPRSAMMSLAVTSTPGSTAVRLAAAESEGEPARVSWFEPPPDAKQFWTETKLEAIPAIRKPRALLTADLDNDKLPEVVVGENAGDGSRLLVFWNIGPGKFQATRIDLTGGLIGVWAHDIDQDGDLDLIGLGANSLATWRNQRLR